tara:strand:- start:174 stop:659 length:486 start_codon:yes stop_codon:yes gene_type:complete
MSAYTKVIDNLEDIRVEWVPFSDQVMGGISEVKVYELEEEGMSFYRLEGNVSTENNGGFIQVRAGVNLRNKNIEGIRIKVRGNNNEYFLHLRSPRMLPWNYYSAKFYASQEWMVIDLPLSSFEYSRDSSKSFNSSKIKTIGLVAFGKDFFAQVDLAGVELY